MSRLERLFVWLGGAMFVASVATCVYMYVVTWASPLRSDATTSIAIDAVLFTMFGVHHSLFARDWIKIRVERAVPRRLLRSVYVWTASLLLLTVLALWAPIGGDVYQASGATAITLTVIQLAGLWLIARAVATIDPLELAGIRLPSGPGALNVSGPYRFVRHPVYLGWILAVFGAAHMTGDRLAFAAMTTAYLLLAIPWEERSLLGAFGAEYARYRQRVRWRVVPFVY